MKLVFGPHIKSDLLEIASYIAKDSPFHAEKTIAKIYAECLRIAERPRIFRIRDDIRPNLRLAPVDRYVILYDLSDTAVEIVRIFHGMRNLPRLL